LEALSRRQLRLLPVTNEFFGGNVAVAGLLVGGDVKNAIARDTGDAGLYVLPDIALKGDVFLDDVPLSEVAELTDAAVVAVPPTAEDLLKAVAA
ncbi:MAG: DUF512 domain-containing protein, partial [Acidimicrobiia bacterium]|nr:DUF512 domain-containing protein [Acidimicrobiia bacterium]